MQFSIVGPGRAGGSFAAALISVGWTHVRTYGRSDDVRLAAQHVDLILLTVPDGVIASVANLIEPDRAVLVHVAGSQTLDVLGAHERVGSVHPLMTLSDASAGADRLLDNCAYAIAGDEITRSMVDALGGRVFEVADKDRMGYHATAAVASNHLTALVSQVERMSAQAGLPADAFHQLMRVSLENALDLGAEAAITGPASRGDWDTVRGHLSSLGEADRKLYLVLAAEAAGLAGQAPPEDIIPA